MKYIERIVQKILNDIRESLHVSSLFCLSMFLDKVYKSSLTIPKYHNLKPSIASISRVSRSYTFFSGNLSSLETMRKRVTTTKKYRKSRKWSETRVLSSRPSGYSQDRPDRPITPAFANSRHPVGAKVNRYQRHWDQQLVRISWPECVRSLHGTYPDVQIGKTT